MNAGELATVAYKAIVFDYDDTLVRTREVRYATLMRVARERYGFDLQRPEIDAAWGTPGDEFMRMLFDRQEPDLARLWGIYNEECKQDPNEAHPGALDFLQTFSRRLPLGILTSSSRRRVLPELAETRIDESPFVRIQTAEDTPLHKPNPAVFAPWIAWAAEQSATADEILYVGDTLNDHAAAIGAGLRFIGMAHTSREQDLFRDSGIRFVGSFKELAVTLS